MRDPRQRLLYAAGLLASVVALGSVGFYVLGDGQWSLKECVYFTFITLTTVGYGETLPDFSQVPHAREFTVLVLVFGMGTVLYFVSTLTASIVEGDLQRALRRTRMLKKIKKLNDHVIVCGAGSTGEQVIAELATANVPTVMIDCSQERLEHLAEDFKDHDIKYLVGDATDDIVLEDAQLETCRGMVACLANDKDNLYLVVSARQANPKARIVARGSSLAMLSKLKRAGASAVVSPNYIGGLRMVSELIRPQVVRFLDEMLRDPNSDMRIDEVVVGADSKIAGKQLRATGIRDETEVLVLAAKDSDGVYFFNPGADYVVEPGITLVVLGPVPQVSVLRRMAGHD
jgi:voltage-gated potassium channel